MAPPAEPSDETLMLLYRDGDVGAFEMLYRRHKGGLYRYFLRQCRDPAGAAEMFQDVWMNVIGARTRYVASARFATYLYRLAHNRLVDHYRKSAHAELALDDSDCEEPGAARHDEPDVQFERRSLGARLLEAIEALPALQREAFVLQHEGGLSLEEIAAATGVNRETAKSRLRYALQKLRASMSEWR
ncbi:MAG TPA: RNA polymerase sigma factor [Burkholderiales bacterium]|nr:RNA polymerase sigma factor [Burkholderiales bacterium]